MERRFNPPPGWPRPPDGWLPPRGWQPDPGWPPAPFGWRYFVEDHLGDEARASTPTSTVEPSAALQGTSAAEVPDSVAWSAWLRDARTHRSLTHTSGSRSGEPPAVQAARAAQVARRWAGLEEDLPAHEFGTVRWAGEGDTPDEGMHLSRPTATESWVGVKPLPAGALPAGGHPSDPPADVTDWLDRLYGPPPTPGVREHDLGPLNRPPRRAGVPAHAANDPGRFRNLVESDPAAADPGCFPITAERRTWPRKRIVLPMVVLLGVAGLGTGRSALQAVDPTSAQVTLTDPPLLVGQKRPDGGLVTAAPRVRTSPTPRPRPTGRHQAATPSPEATKAELKAEAEATARPRTTTTTLIPTGSRPTSSWSSRRPWTTAETPQDDKHRDDKHRDDKRQEDNKRQDDQERHARHRRPDPRPNRDLPWPCDPNYVSSCVPVAPDVDCLSSGGDGPAYLAVPARVVGKDIYNLDANGDGWACEPRQRR